MEEAYVSILTPAEAGVQRVGDDIGRSLDWFQSSPPPRRGCNRRDKVEPDRLACFNPHPRRGGGATRISSSLPTPPSFNPHPRRGGGATARKLGGCRLGPFQSSPPPRRGCNVSLVERYEVAAADLVSILTPAEAGVQRDRVGAVERPQLSFNPHPRRGGGATCRLSRTDGPTPRFNPHPRRGGGATGKKVDAEGNLLPTFQSSPPPRRGCNIRTRAG